MIETLIYELQGKVGGEPIVAGPGASVRDLVRLRRPEETHAKPILTIAVLLALSGSAHELMQPGTPPVPVTTGCEQSHLREPFIRCRVARAKTHPSGIYPVMWPPMKIERKGSK
jgi:hypothetical protein